jgi:hypothetical protein
MIYILYLLFLITGGYLLWRLYLLTDKSPEMDRNWTTIYYGARGSGKTLHQATEVKKTLEYLTKFYSKKDLINKKERAIIFTNQKLSKELENLYLNKYLYYWENIEDIRYCPRKDCWRGKQKHPLHGAYVIFDDITTILPPDSWNITPQWLRKYFFLGRHYGIHILANLQDPFAVDVNFRRCVDMAYRFHKIISSRDPDETKKPLKFIYGLYIRRRIPAEWLWRIGDMSEGEIQAQKEMADRVEGSPFRDIFIASRHLITANKTKIYDTLADVAKEIKPKGFIHTEYHCIDKRHNHTDPKAPNYCNYKKVYHELV